MFSAITHSTICSCPSLISLYSLARVNVVCFCCHWTPFCSREKTLVSNVLCVCFFFVWFLLRLFSRGTVCCWYNIFAFLSYQTPQVQFHTDAIDYPSFFVVPILWLMTCRFQLISCLCIIIRESILSNKKKRQLRASLKSMILQKKQFTDRVQPYHTVRINWQVCKEFRLFFFF